MNKHTDSLGKTSQNNKSACDLYPRNALTIAERISLIITKNSAGSSPSQHEDDQLDKWIHRGDLFNNDLLKRRLSVNGWNIEDYLDAVSGEGSVPLDTCKNCFLSAQYWQNSPKHVVENDPYGYVVRGFLNAASYSFETLLSHLRIAQNHLPNVHNDLLQQLGKRLMSLALKPIIVKLDSAKNNNELHASEAHERLVEFAEQFGDSDNIIGFYEQSPWLLRRLSTITQNFIDYVDEVSKNISEKWQEILDLTQLDSDHTFVRSISFGQGDTHHGGKTVTILELNDCAQDVERKIVYKPRNRMGLEIVKEVDKILGKCCEYHRLHFPRSIESDNFTIFEFIEHSPCSSPDDVIEYYYKFGHLVGLCYLLNITDMHYENVVASGPNPVAVDLETCLSVPLSYVQENPQLDNTLVTAVRQSVLASLLLPIAFPIDEKGNTVNLSALGGERQELPIPMYVPVDLNTDHARYESKTVYLDEAQNRVLNNEVSTEPNEYVKNILDGLKAALNAAIEFRDEIVNILSKHSNSFNRVLIRDTNRYARLLEYSYHPTALKNALETEKIFENLYALELVNQKPIEHEIVSLQNSDIPIFYSRNDSDHIFDENLNDLGTALEASPLSLCLSKLNGLDSEVVRLQVGIARAAITGEESPDDECAMQFPVSVRDLLMRLQKKIYITNANAISGWITVEDTGRGAIPQISRSNFYDGLFGVAFTYLSGFRIFKDVSFLHTAIGLINTAIRSMSTKTEMQNAHQGLLSGLQLFSLGCKEYLTPFQTSMLINHALDYKIDLNDSEIKPDLITGYSGYISIYAKTSKVLNDDTFCFKAEEAAIYLIRNLDSILSSTQTHGLGHGLPGVLMALTDVYQITNDSYYLRATKKVFNALLDRQDFLQTSALSWCNGIEGTALGMCKADSILQENHLNELSQLLSLIKENDISSDCLCHGQSGLALTYFELGRSLNRSDLVHNAEEELKAIKTRWANSNRLRLRNLDGVIRPGLFTGVSGVAYAEMRLSHPDDITSILI